jgi:hypothetical protein
MQSIDQENNDLLADPATLGIDTAPLKKQWSYWEVDSFFRCPLFGTCLTLTEQKQLIKKSGITVKTKTDYDIHEILVASSESESRLSRRINRLLNRKYSQDVASATGFNDDQFMAYFKAAFFSDDYAGPLWAAASHPALTTATKREIFGMIHMAMHWNSEQRVKMRRAQTRHQNELKNLRNRLSQAHSTRRQLSKENQRLMQANAKFKAAIDILEKAQQASQPAPAETNDEALITTIKEENRTLSMMLDKTSRQLKSLQERLKGLDRQNAQLSSDITQERMLNQRYREEAKAIMVKFTGLKRCNSDCPAYDLCKKRVLLVGGITRMASLYRDLIESSGGLFDYHDGYLKKGARQLETCLKRADVVLCPVNCNSHAACSVVKNVAKKHQKTVHMLHNSSLNAISQAIWGSDNSSASIN